jgi:hypothetical protein
MIPRSLLLTALLCCALPACTGEDAAQSCEDTFKLCPERTRPVAACAPGAQCITLDSCDTAQLCQRDEEVQCEPATCASDELEAGRCASDTPCAGGCAGGDQCRSITQCDEILFCEPNPDCGCQGSSRAVERCPPGYECETTTNCGKTYICQAFMQPCEPAVCPPAHMQVPGCRDNGAECITLESCGARIACERLGAQCNAIPVCPAGGVQTPGGCPNDGSECRDYSLCGTTITCAFPRGCAPQEARGVGDCDASFGVAWDGAQCVLISGCECTGDGCDQLYRSFDACKDDHQICR